MEGAKWTDVVRRWPGNPCVSLEHLGFRVADILNAGVAQVGDEVLLVVTIETLQGHECLYLARSTDGQHFTVDGDPFMLPSGQEPWATYEGHGIRDPRITRMNGTHYITYVADGDHGLRLGLAKTDDFKSVERIAFVSQVDVKNGCLFPRKINGRYAMLSRPDPGVSIWVGYSDDLEYWGDETVVMTPRGGFWDPSRIGVAAPPIETKHGWLLLYYGEKHTSAGPLVRLGAAVLDLYDPSIVLHRSNIPILSPREKYERIGDVPNVVFSCGAIYNEQTDVIRIYYGASDSCICIGETTLDELVRTCIESEKEL